MGSFSMPRMGLVGMGSSMTTRKCLLEVELGVVLGRVVVVEQVEAEEMRQLRIDAVAGEAATQAVTPVVHGGHAAQRQLAAHARARLVAHAHEAAASEDALLGFLPVGCAGAEFLAGARHRARRGHARHGCRCASPGLAPWPPSRRLAGVVLACGVEDLLELVEPVRRHLGEPELLADGRPARTERRRSVEEGLDSWSAPRPGPCPRSRAIRLRFSNTSAMPRRLWQRS